MLECPLDGLEKDVYKDYDKLRSNCRKKDCQYPSHVEFMKLPPGCVLLVAALLATKKKEGK